MINRRLKITSLVVIAAMAAVAAAALARLPAGTQLPTHWNMAGKVDGTADAATALFLPVILAAFVALLMAALPRLDWLGDNLARSAPLYRTAWGAVLVLLVGIEALIAGPAFGIVLSGTLPLAGAGLVLVTGGNVLPKSRPGFFIGIRTPWTLTDAENWIATHRFGAWTTMAAGVALVVAAIAPMSVRPALVAAACALCLVPLPYSWWLWHRATRA